MNEIVEKALKEVNDSIGKNISVINELSCSHYFKLRGDEDMLKLAVVNLIENAIEAMPEVGIW